MSTTTTRNRGNFRGTNIDSKLYRIVMGFSGRFYVLDKSGFYLLRQDGTIRRFNSEAGARKAITRQRTGNFHD